MEITHYAAPNTIAGIRRVFSLDRQFMADAGCLFRLTIFGRCVEVWGPEQR